MARVAHRREDGCFNNLEDSFGITTVTMSPVTGGAASTSTGSLIHALDQAGADEWKEYMLQVGGEGSIRVSASAQ